MSGRKEQHKEESWWPAEGTAGEAQPRCMCVYVHQSSSFQAWAMGPRHQSHPRRRPDLTLKLGLVRL